MILLDLLKEFFWRRHKLVIGWWRELRLLK
jgi:hypothetical protein